MRKYIIILLLFVCSMSFGQMFSAQNAGSGFVITMTKTTSAENNTISFTLNGTGTVNIDWGDGTNETYTLSSSPKEHMYVLYSNITVKIYHNNNITTLGCFSNLLTSLDVSSCTSLTTLSCFSNLLTSLDVSSNTALTTLYCYSNLLTNVNVSGCTSLISFYCYSNLLTILDISSCTSLFIMLCYSNSLNQTNVDAVINSIYNHSINSGNLYIQNNTAPSATGLSQINTLKTTRGWTISHD